MTKINVYSINARQCVTQGNAPKYTAVDFIGLCTYPGRTMAIVEMEDGVLEEHVVTNLQFVHEDKVELVDTPEVKKVDATKKVKPKKSV